MIRSARFLVAALFVLSPLHVGCGAVLGYESDYGVGGVGGTTAATACDASSPKFRCVGAEIVQICNTASLAYETGAFCSAGERCDATLGACVSSAGGAAGAGARSGSGGAGAGATTQAGSGGSSGGSAGVGGATQGGNAGAAQGGNAGAGQGGNAGGGQGGNAGGSQGGNAGVSQGGNAGTGLGGTGGAAAGSAGATQGGSAGSGPINPTDCSVIYVDPSATKAGGGCDPDDPLSTLTAAIEARKDFTTEIRICAGALEGPTVQLNVPVSLQGSYDCKSWTRESPLRVETLTTILKSTQEGAAVVVSTAAIGRSITIEGIHFIGASIGKKSRALAITTGAKPLLRRNRIQGGKGVGPDFPALGVQITNGAAPRLEGNLIESGAGETDAATVASVGLLLSENAGPAEIVGNTIKGGPALLHGKGYGSVGLFILPLETAKLTGDATIANNVISGGDANDTANSVEFLSVGAFLDETSAGPRGTIHFRGGSIRAGTASHDGAPSNGRVPSAIGLHSGKHVALEISGVRLLGGDSSEKTGSGIAVSLGGPGTTIIRSSVLHGGGVLDTTPSPRAIETRQTGLLSVLGSTLFLGNPRVVSGGSASAKGIYASGLGPLDLRGNLFVFQNGQATAVQLEDTCSLPKDGASRLGGNAFVASRKVGQIFFSGTACPNGAGATMASFAAIFGPPSGNNYRVTPMATEASDIGSSCDTDVDCVDVALNEYDEDTYGRSQALDLTSGKFSPKSCVLAKGSVALPEAPVDLLGNPRPAGGGTIGAIQLVGVDTCP